MFEDAFGSLRWICSIMKPERIFMRNKTRFIWGGLLILIGVITACKALGWFDFEFEWKLIFPIIIIVLGVMILVESVSDKSDKIDGNTDKDEIAAVFAGQKIKFDNQDIEDKKVSAVFGGAEVDLRKAKIKEEAHIKVDAIFGGVKVMVPKDVVAEVNSTSIFGGITNKTTNEDDDDDDEEKKSKKTERKKKIYIDAICMFGGVEVK